MPEWIKVLLQLLAQFTGVQGGVDNSIVVYGIAASFYSGLFLFARSNFRDTSSARDHLLMWGFLLGACRELFMIGMAVMLAEGLVSMRH